MLEAHVGHGQSYGFIYLIHIDRFLGRGWEEVDPWTGWMKASNTGSAQTYNLAPSRFRAHDSKFRALEHSTRLRLGCLGDCLSVAIVLKSMSSHTSRTTWHVSYHLTVGLCQPPAMVLFLVEKGLAPLLAAEFTETGLLYG